jgi:hypothetical protein
MLESGMFNSLKSDPRVKRGDFLMLLNSRARFLKYLRCILIGLPTWFVVGILIILAPEFSKILGVQGDVTGAKAIMYCYGGLVAGDVLSGFASQVFRSRKRIVLAFLVITSALIITYLSSHRLSVPVFYGLCFVMGIGIGYWAVFVTIAAEQFGTNLRSTVTTTVPNFVRGGVVLITLSFQSLRPAFGLVGAAYIVGFVTMAIALVSLYFMEETYHKDLDYHER